MSSELTLVDSERGRVFRDGLTTQDKARFFANARAGAKQGYWGRDCFESGFRGYKPTLGGLIVVNDDDPPKGFAERADAVNAARRFKAGAASYLTQVSA